MLPHVADETSMYFEQADVYRNSELYALGHSDGNDSEEEGSMVSYAKLEKKMTPVTEDGGKLYHFRPNLSIYRLVSSSGVQVTLKLIM